MTSLSRLAFEMLRHDRSHTLTRIIVTGTQVTMILNVVGIEYGIASHKGIVQTQMAVLVLVSFSFITGVSLLFGIFDSYGATLERAQDIAILKVFGGSSWHIVSLLAQEALMIAGAGTLLGIGTTYFVRWLIALSLPTYMSLEVAYAWWAIAGAIVALWAVLGMLLAWWKIQNEHIARLLSEKE